MSFPEQQAKEAWEAREAREEEQGNQEEKEPAMMLLLSSPYPIMHGIFTYDCACVYTILFASFFVFCITYSKITLLCPYFSVPKVDVRVCGIYGHQTKYLYASYNKKANS